MKTEAMETARYEAIVIRMSVPSIKRRAELLQLLYKDVPEIRRSDGVMVLETDVTFGGEILDLAADIVVFEPAKVRDLATFEDPHRYATGIVHVLVNGIQVLRDGEHTAAKPGRVVRGPGARAREGQAGD